MGLVTLQRWISTSIRIGEMHRRSRHVSPVMQASVAAAICLGLCLSAPNLHAQGYGTISGLVTDPSGAIIPSATVTATAPQRQ